MVQVPKLRIRTLNQSPLQPGGDYVLYWMIANRRTQSNFSLQRAVELATSLKKPLIIFEAIRINYKWASDRLHRFVMRGMASQRQNFENVPVTYYCYVEPEQNHGTGLLEALAEQACVVITDDFPCFFLPTMLKMVARRLTVKLEAIDSNGLFPMRATNRIFVRAHDFRRFLQRELPHHLLEHPLPHPLQDEDLVAPVAVPEHITNKWEPASDELLLASPESLSKLAIDHNVRPAAFEGGEDIAGTVLQTFLRSGLERYAEDRNHPDTDASSGLSPYLHFGNISAHTIFNAIAEKENWSPAHLSEKVTGSREGWWGMSPAAEGFLDELITWREIGYNMCANRSDYDQYSSLPDWALQTLEEHVLDPRPHNYSLAEFEQSRTHDDIWNAAQRQLVCEGRMHNYLRMLWGKKILEWTSNPRVALQIMIELNNKYAVDGRNPNSYSGIFWVLGRYDRAWGPERKIYGKIRYMTSENTQRKLKMKEYLKKHSQRRTLF